MIKQKIFTYFSSYKMKILFDKNQQQEKHHSQHQIMCMNSRQSVKSVKLFNFVNSR